MFMYNPQPTILFRTYLERDSLKRLEQEQVRCPGSLAYVHICHLDYQSFFGVYIG